MELVRWEPFTGFGNLHSVLNDWFDNDGDRSPAQPRAWYPAVDVLEGKDAGIGPLLIWQKLAERVGVLDGRGLQGLKAVALKGSTDGRQHAGGGPDVLGGRVLKALRQTGLRASILVRFGHASFAELRGVGGCGGL